MGDLWRSSACMGHMDCKLCTAALKWAANMLLHALQSLHRSCRTAASHAQSSITLLACSQTLASSALA